MTFRCSRHTSFLGLVLIFSVAFIFTPYWTLGATIIQKALFLSGTIGAGLIWAFLCAADLSITFDKKVFPALIICLVIMLILNLPALCAEIPWCGDEEFHIAVTGNLVIAARRHTLLFAVPFLFLAIVLLFRRSKPWLFYFVSALLFCGISAACGVFLPFIMNEAVRYPFFLRYLSAIPVLPVSIFTHCTPEILYRIVPFFSSVAVVWLCATRWSGRSMVSAAAAATAVATMPLVFYYSSILFLEMPAILLLSMVFFNADTILGGSLNKIKTYPAWMALVLIGMVKETVAPMIAACLVCRALVRGAFLLRSRAGVRAWADEGVFAFCSLFLIAVYLWFRNLAHVNRVLHPHPANFLDGEIYTTIARAFTDQFGICIALAIAGLMVLMKQKRYASLLLCCCSFVFQMAFFILDEKGIIGYCRYNLLLLPPLLFCMGAAVKPFLERWKIAGSTILGAIAVLNLLHSPINLDGSRKSHWGNYLCDNGEHSYPYRKTINWIVAQGFHDNHILLTGLDWYYFWTYYADFPNLRVDYVSRPASPTEEERLMANKLTDAFKNKFDLVIYHPMNVNTLPVTIGTGYRLCKTFRNRERTLFLFSNPTIDTARHACSLNRTGK